MPYLKTYDIFISHAWSYGDDYKRLTNLLNSAPLFYYRNYSAPKDKPLHNLNSTDVRTKAEIRDAIERKIRPVNSVLIISGMYYNYHNWMQVELDIAKKLNKPIIALLPYGYQRVPADILNYATDIVGWRTESIVSAIRRHGV